MISNSPASNHSKVLRIIGKGAWAASFIFLLGRFDWTSANRSYSLEGYLASAWMLVLLLPTIFFTTTLLISRRSAFWVTLVFTTICVLPYRWLGFAGTRFWSDRFAYSDWIKDLNPPLPSIIWFPAAFSRGQVIPNELLVFALLIACGIISILLATRGRLRRTWFIQHPAWSVAAVAFILILVQSWLHLSLRAPYSYQMHYAEPKPLQKAWITYDANGHPSIRIDQVPQAHGWWHLYLFSDYRGAVNHDYGDFRTAEQVFQGIPPDQSTPIMRRMLTFYLSSQFVCFFNPYYVFIFLNTAFWLAATLAGYDWARRLFDVQTAVIFALFIATGCGFIFFVNQPTCYLTGYAIEIITIYFFHRLIIEEKSRAGVYLFALIYCLGLMTTDLIPLLVLFPVYAWAQRAGISRTLASLTLACAAYGISLAFLAFIAHVPNLSGNANLAGNPIAELKGVSLDTVYILCLEFLNRFAMDMVHGFAILPLLPAILGSTFLRCRRRLLLVAALFLPAFLTIAFLEFSGGHFNNWPLAALPRLAYIAYPAVYLLAALGLVEGSRAIFPTHPRIARAIPCLFLLAVFILNNLDVFGIPSIYYHFYFGLNSNSLVPFRNPQF